MPVRTLVASAAALILLCLVAGCHEASGNSRGHAKPGASLVLVGKPPHRLTCTVGMLSDVAKNLGGERLEVSSLMGPGTDPHLYNTTPGDRKQLRDSDMVFYAGHHLEGKMGDVLGRMSTRIPTLAVCERIDHDRLLMSGGAVDPHLWFDVDLWSRAAEIMRDELIRLDPDGREIYTANTAAYREQLAKLHEYVKNQIATIPEQRRVLVTAHDAFGYFGRAYGVDVLGIQGLSTESEAAVSRINELVDTIVDRGIPAVFVESTISERSIRSLIEGCEARGHSLTIGGSLYSDAMGAIGTPAETYIGMVRHNVDTLVKALK